MPAQLNRRSVERGAPSLGGLRESGSIEADADVVMLLARQFHTEGDMAGPRTAASQSTSRRTGTADRQLGSDLPRPLLPDRLITPQRMPDRQQAPVGHAHGGHP